MISSHTTQQHIPMQNKHSLANTAIHLPARVALRVRRWICAGCGMAHAGSFPEECESCGATALEFQYAPPAEMGSRS